MGTVTKALIGEEDINYWEEGSSTTTFTRPGTVGSTVTMTKVKRDYQYDALRYGTFTQAGITAALAAIGTTTKATLLFRPGTWVISSNADWSAYTNVTFRFLPGCLISHGTFTLNIPNVDAGLYQIFSGTGAITISRVREVYPEWWTTNTTPGTTDMTAAILAAIATKQTVRLQSITYAHTGGLDLNNPGQMFLGSGKQNSTYAPGTLLKKLSGTSVDFKQSADYSTVKDIAIDNNNLGGDAFLVTGHYLSSDNVITYNQGATGYGFHTNSVNISSLKNITTSRAKIEDTLYTSIHHLMCSGGMAGYVLHITGSEKIDLFDFTFENSTDVESMYVDTSYNININGLKFEPASVYAASLISIASTVRNINFRSVGMNYSLLQTQPFFTITGALGVTIDGIDIAEQGVSPVAGNNFIVLADTPKNIAIRNAWVKVTNTFNFINYSGTTAYYVSLENVNYQTGAGTCNWMAFFVKVTNSNMLQTFAAGGSAYVFENVSGSINTANCTVNDSVTLINSNTYTDASGLASKVSGGFVSVYKTVASATALDLPVTGDIFLITGTTSITSIGSGGSIAGRKVTLVFADSLTFTDGSNLKIAGNFSTSADDTISIVCDGTNWYETGRSAN